MNDALRILKWLAVATVLGGCANERAADPTKNSIPVAAESPDSETEVTGDGPTEKRFQGIALTVPAGWTEKPPASEFLQAEFQLTGAGGIARLTMSSTGGGLEANLDRWRGQIQPGSNDPAPQEETVRVGDRDAVIVELTGQFQDQMSSGGTRSEWTLLGAAIPTGPAHFFLKLTGPRKSVAEHRDAFRQMVATARLDD
ncbi:MAG TPA: hypothetical protein VM165_04370 [Planctomycetaceae bacterium]|nr:hypothetical protein [Planctomycetaceae bacterium]